MGNMWPGMQGGMQPGMQPGMQGGAGGMWGWPQGQPGWTQPLPPPPGDDAGSRSMQPRPSRGGGGGCGGSRGSGGPGGGRDFDGWGESVAPETGPPDDVPIFLEPAVEEFIPVPKALLGKVIGKQAQTIIEIREKSGAFKVDARDQTSDPCMVKVAGTAEAVKKAKALIMELIDSTQNKHAGSDFVEIPRAKIGMVIGLKGSQVNEIQNQTNTKIDVDFESDPCKCFIKGSPDSVDRAKKVLLTIAMQIEDDNSEYVDLPKATSGALIGAQGTRIREFQEQSGARIDVDKTGTRCRVRLTGNSEQIAAAKSLILNEVEHSLPQVNRPLALPSPSQQPMVIPAHQPTSFPATLSESIARAKAAAEAVKNGLVTAMPDVPDFAPSAGFGGFGCFGGFGSPGGGGGFMLPPPPPSPAVPPPSFAGGFGGAQPYRPW